MGNSGLGNAPVTVNAGCRKPGTATAPSARAKYGATKAFGW